MFSIIKIAWRNLWRNKRRTIITVASVFFGVLLSAYMTSMQEGTYDKIVDIVVKFYSGYIQIHNKEFWENKSINNSFDLTDSLVQQVTSHQEANRVFPRLESFSLVSSGNLTKGAIILGIDPLKEDEWTQLSSKIRQGNYLKEGDTGVVLGEGLSNYLKTGVGDSLIMISQGYHGISAAGKFPVRGIIRHVSPELDKIVVYLDLKQCQEFFSATGKITSLVVNVSDSKSMRSLHRKLKREVTDPLDIMSWEEMYPEILQQIESDRAGGIILKIVLYMVVAFGILATTMMMISERKKEMGVMVSIGMQKTRLAFILFTETLFIGLLGVLTGFIAGIPVVYFQAAHPLRMSGVTGKMLEEFGFEPYMFFSTASKVFTHQMVTIFILCLLVAVYPVVTALRFNVIKSVRK